MLAAVLKEPEGRTLEFQAARRQMDFEKMVRYCAAIANERGGHLVLGVTDQRPRTVVGTSAVSNPEGMSAKLLCRLPLRIDIESVEHPDGRVVVLNIPSRPIGRPIAVDGAYWMRSGDRLVSMTSDVLQSIFAEAVPDFSAQPVSASLDVLDISAVEVFRAGWVRKSGNDALRALPIEQLLQDASLLAPDGRPTIAALVLFSREQAMVQHLAQAEFIFEYRSRQAAGPASQRVSYQRGFFLWFDELWHRIDLRNDHQHFQSGLFMLDVPAFDEAVVRELVLNAVSHRDYQRPGSVFVRQYPDRFEVVSPGGFPPGITPENVLWKQEPRNRLLASTLEKCGLVERAGQGMDRVFEHCIRHAKARPDFVGTDAWSVSVTVRGAVQDQRFLDFLERLGQERLATFGTFHLLALDHIRRDEEVPDVLKWVLSDLIDHGAVERIGRGAKKRYILSRKLHAHLGQAGTYTRKRGLDHGHNKALLLKHVTDSAAVGAKMSELLQVLPDKTRGQIKTLMSELRDEGKVECRGRTAAARWFLLGSASGPTTK